MRVPYVIVQRCETAQFGRWNWVRVCGTEKKDLREEFTACEPEVKGGQLRGQLQLRLALVCTGSWLLSFYSRA